MTRLRKVVDERDARACLSALARSGETLRGWARRNEVDGRSLRAWQINLSRGAKSALARRAPAKLVELVPVSMPVMGRRYVVRVGVGSVEVGDDFDAGSLVRIVEVLRSC
jgi:hypothetical protein